MTIKVRVSKSKTKLFVGKTINQKVIYNIGPKDTIDDDEIKEEINVVDDESDDEDKKDNKFIARISKSGLDGRQSKTSNNRKREGASKLNHEWSNKRVKE